MKRRDLEALVDRALERGMCRCVVTSQARAICEADTPLPHWSDPVLLCTRIKSHVGPCHHDDTVDLVASQHLDAALARIGFFRACDFSDVLKLFFEPQMERQADRYAKYATRPIPPGSPLY